MFLFNFILYSFLYVLYFIHWIVTATCYLMVVVWAMWGGVNPAMDPLDPIEPEA